MINLLLVDDERFSREGIANTLFSSGLPIDNLIQADNGLSALKSVDGLIPHILLTDIKMPKMNGLELAHKIKEKYPLCKIIFMSGYSDKEYLKTAIRLKAIEYIEKPIDVNELCDATKKAINECKEDDSILLLDTQYNTTLHNSIPIIKRNFALNLVKSKIDIKSVANEIELYGLNDLLSSEFRTGLIKFSLPCDNLNEYINQEQFEDLVENTLQQLNINAFYTFKSEDMFIIHFYCVREKSANCSSNTLNYECVNIFFEKLLSNINTPCFISVGNIAERIDQIFFSYQTAAINMEKSFFHDYNEVIFTTDDHYNVFSFDDIYVEQFYISLLEKNMELSLNLLNSLMSNLILNKGTLVSQIKNFYLKIISVMIKFSEEYNLDFHSDFSLDEMRSEVLEIPTLNLLNKYIIKKTEYIFRSINQNNINSSVWQIIKYIKKNYTNQSLSIQDISDYMNLSMSYICVIFKSATNQTVNSYITNIRIEDAKKLLINSNESLVQIAKTVGYGDVKYFCKTFKKITEISPSEFKNKYKL